MGKGKHNTRTGTNHDQHLESTSLSTPHRLPTLSEIKVKIPAHCFRPTVRQSMSYVGKDIVYVALTFAVMYQLVNMFKFGYLLFPLYWYIQGTCSSIRSPLPFIVLLCVGTLYTSLFVLGHDCGHGSFSFYPLLNDIVGTCTAKRFDIITFSSN